MKKQQNKVHMINISLCLIGTLLIAIAVNSFVIPGNLGEGGSIVFHPHSVPSSLTQY